jgi:hypothetical protein
MRKTKIPALLSAILITALVGCSASEKETPPGPTLSTDLPIAELPSPESLWPDPCIAAIEYQNELKKLRQRYAEDHPDVVRLRKLAERQQAKCSGAVDQTPRSGEWVKKDGALVCDGYMTRRADQDYCSAEIPEDWVPFTYDGKEYYMQPSNETR